MVARASISQAPPVTDASGGGASSLFLDGWSIVFVPF
jgi:hypothetical protein